MWTTSRYSSKESRKLAKKVALDCSSVYVARGTKSIDELSRLARRIGESRINIIAEEQGEPEYIETVAVGEFGNWGWFDEKIQIKKEKNK